MANAKKSTIYDVANYAGVSISTVSRVLNSPDKVKERTRKLVLDAIKALDFTLHAEAAARARKQLKRIGVLTSFFSEPSFVERLRGISNSLSRNEFEMIIYTVQNDSQLYEYLDMLPHSNRIDGLIILSMRIEQNYREQLFGAKFPVVFVEHSPPGFSSVSIDNMEGGRLAATHLAKKGYKKLAFIGEYAKRSSSLTTTDQRLAGFKAGMSEMNLDPQSLLVMNTDFESHMVKDFIPNLLKGSAPPNAIFANSDLIASKLMLQAQEAGVSIPGDLGIIGFDDIDMAEYMGLTTIRQELDASGKLAAELVIHHINENSYPAQKIMLDVSVVDRGSC